MKDYGLCAFPSRAADAKVDLHFNYTYHPAMTSLESRTMAGVVGTLTFFGALLNGVILLLVLRTNMLRLNS